MDKIVFEYNGKIHSGQLVSSTNIEPHYHWVYFSDESITRLINDDCIGFKMKGDALQPTRVISNHQELVDTVKKIIESRIN
jgi:hypothetical protein